MSTLAALIAAMLAATAGQQDSAQIPDATLSFDSQTWVPDGYAYGIDAVDDAQRELGRGLEANVGAGRRTIRFSCPGSLDSALTFEFEAGRKYELVCSVGAEAKIRPIDC